MPFTEHGQPKARSSSAEQVQVALPIIPLPETKTLGRLCICRLRAAKGPHGVSGLVVTIEGVGLA